MIAQCLALEDKSLLFAVKLLRVVIDVLPVLFVMQKIVGR
ncbi:hypothetical protein N474_02755 [Pseudoalteromonas luteoviolacea CPMOR-2]|uniref:Uncharacterized protein n=1 Tax=Pseudoalteromonas luteoviolacea DSM 6061 TaxID=1365250 RepID=A0A166VZP3_9GAMM|nr:hypothetical protein N475_03120 [Pseudoalteromonas luteoviolacea DSM 6061]KZN52852.1 hypothetical protein N474_02755 [Pseudoalteromonas luteoviolacea CPMOR-2]